MANTEVNYQKLTEEHKRLFQNAKASEVSSFIKTEAVRKCLSQEEAKEARDTNRILKARWVLVWKDVPGESQPEAREDAMKNENAVHTKDGKQKAKARIVLLGFQHPDLLDPTFNTTSPVQSQLMRHLSLAMVAQRGWTLEGLDMKTAFLQTGKTEEARKL